VFAPASFYLHVSVCFRRHVSFRRHLITSLPGALLLDKEGGGVPTRPSPMLVKMEERMLVLRCPGMSGMSLGVRLPTLGPIFMLGWCRLRQPAVCYRQDRLGPQGQICHASTKSTNSTSIALTLIIALHVQIPNQNLSFVHTEGEKKAKSVRGLGLAVPTTST
jgi:hypothetical protein